jgi:RNA polymerase sigma-70 factor (ECF subfamily)
MYAAASGTAEPQRNEITEIFSLYHQRVAVWARRLGGLEIDVEDTVQEVFLLAHRRLPGFKGRERLVVWLYRITENVVLHQRRRLRRQHRSVVSARHDETLAAEMPSSADLPPEQVEKRENLQLIYRVLDRMSERNRTMIILFELEEWSGQEIAEMKGVKVGTVWVWLHRARAQFRRLLAEARASVLPEPGERR